MHPIILQHNLTVVSLINTFIVIFVYVDVLDSSMVALNAFNNSFL